MTQFLAPKKGVELQMQMSLRTFSDHFWNELVGDFKFWKFSYLILGASLLLVPSVRQAGIMVTLLSELGPHTVAHLLTTWTQENYSKILNLSYCKNHDNKGPYSLRFLKVISAKIYKAHWLLQSKDLPCGQDQN